jgi:hypothetical protein
MFPDVSPCKRKADANVIMLGTVMPASANAGLNLDNKG